MTNRIVYRALLIFALLISATCDSANRPSGGGDQIVAERARQAAEVLLSTLSISAAARVGVTGPVAPGSIIQETVAAPQGAARQLAVPAAAGDYFCFFIDDHPGMLYGHEVRYAWVEAASGANMELAADFMPEIVHPSGASAPFTPVENFTVQGVVFDLGTGDFAGELVDIADRPVFDPERSTSADNPPRRVALVVDGGNELSWGDFGTSKASKENADLVKAFLQGRGFEVKRASQHWEGSDAVLPFSGTGRTNNSLADALHAAISFYARQLVCPPDGAPGVKACHEFFFYFSGHCSMQDPVNDVPGSLGFIMLFSADGAGKMSIVTFQDLFTWLGEFGPCVKVVVFIDSCYSGQAIDGFNAVPAFSANRQCGWTVITTCGSDETTLSGSTFESATEFWARMENWPDEQADQDQDSKGDDLGDRVLMMRAYARGQLYNNPPEVLMSDHQTGMCSTD